MVLRGDRRQFARFRGVLEPGKPINPITIRKKQAEIIHEKVSIAKALGARGYTLWVLWDLQNWPEDHPEKYGALEPDGQPNTVFPVYANVIRHLQATRPDRIFAEGGLFAYGYANYRHKVRRTVELTTDKDIGRDRKIVMMSDLHLGYHNRRKELARWVDMVNAERADVILMAGDVIDMSLRPLTDEDMAAELRRLNAPVYACFGNHEYYSGAKQAEDFFADAGITLLRDSVATVGGVCLIGRDDRSNPRRRSVAELMGRADRGKYTIVMDHQPYHLERTERAGADFQLSGHTHHGQLWPISWITESIYECAAGPWQRGQTHYYVSSGMGIWGGKFRIGTSSEYIVATLRQS